MSVFNHSLVAILLLSGSVGVVAQSRSLPLPTKAVYRCTVDGGVLYSDEPCLGAVKVNAEPTRGMNKMTGHERVGADVARERRNEVLAEAIRPLTGMSPAQFEMARRRTQLSPEAKQACLQLDSRISKQEVDERTTSSDAKAMTQRSLLESRLRYRQLQC